MQQNRYENSSSKSRPYLPLEHVINSGNRIMTVSSRREYLVPGKKVDSVDTACQK